MATSTALKATRTETSAMNLKAFHIFFVTCSAAMCFLASALYGTGAEAGSGVSVMVPAAAWLIGGVLLVFYGVYFLKRFKDWGYL